jgi:hypothetical protein
MIRNLTLRNFRGFQRLQLSQLGRVNLLVGRNNSGKTSVLEAIELLGLRGDLAGLVSPMLRRGEQVLAESDRRIRREAAIAHLFHGHRLDPGVSFEITGTNDGDPERLSAAVVELDPQSMEEAQRQLFEDDADYSPLLALEIRWEGEDTTEETLPITRGGSLSWDALRRRRHDGPPRPVQVITTASLTAVEVVSLFDKIVLTPEEDLLVQALKTIEPSLERIASLASDRPSLYAPAQRGGMVVKIAGVSQRIPIGSFGDGIWRLLGLALSLVGAENGILLVDEIDTGLHFTVMEDMWKLVHETAERLNVQVFATTHSSDCWTSLARVAQELDLSSEALGIQRIEQEREAAVAFSPEEMIIAANRDIEVR